MTNIVFNKIANAQGEDIAFQLRGGGELCFMWLCGYHSDMEGSKASVMDDFARENNHSSLRFDYSGCGKSGGDFEDGTISKWLAESQLMLDQLSTKSVVLVGSSMGGWISLLLAKNNPTKIKAMFLLAPAPDFTEDLMWNNFSEEAKKAIIENGYWLRPSEYDEEPYKITRELIEDGRNHLLLHQEIPINVPVRILHGMQDKDVPFERTIKLAQMIKSDDIRVQFLKSGGHRLSEPHELQILKSILQEISEAIL